MFRGSRNSVENREQGVGVEQWDRTEHHAAGCLQLRLGSEAIDPRVAGSPLRSQGFESL